MVAPNLPELFPQHFPGFERVTFNDLTSGEKIILRKLGAEHFGEYEPSQLAIYRNGREVTFFTPLEMQ